MNHTEFLELANLLQTHDAVFYKFWNLGVPYLSNDIPTAAVYYDFKTNNIIFKLNPEFWEGLTVVQKAFVISHECLHIVLNHFYRAKMIYKAGNPNDAMLLNIAMDLSINHACIERFGFVREEIDPDSKYCWVDTVFKGTKYEENLPPTDLNFEHYYLMLKECQKDMSEHATVDMHGEGMESASNATNDQMRKIFDKINDATTDAERETIKDFIMKDFKQTEQSSGQEAGSDGGNMMRFAQPGKVIKKKKWETIIRKWVRKHMTDSLREEEQWIRESRRMATVAQSNEFFLPSEMEVEGLFKEKNKLNVWFFLDTSGSCSGLGDRFFRAALSIPTTRFNIRIFCFDTSVYETSMETKKLYGFGGTTFTCIERYIQKNCEGKYPDSVWVVTDGYGDRVNPEKPENWHWFLTDNYRACIPNECIVHSLRDFE
jgi:hypothetical protein